MDSTNLPRLLLAALALHAAACGSDVAGGQTQTSTTSSTTSTTTATDCPAPTPGTCAPSQDCVGGVKRTGQASCVGGAWVCDEVACGGAGGAGGTGGAGGGSECSNASVDAKAFDPSCVVAADCITVYAGDLCSDCRCANAAIASSAQAAYSAVVTAAHAPPGQCPCSAPVPPTCVDGVCTPG